MPERACRSRQVIQFYVTVRVCCRSARSPRAFVFRIHPVSVEPSGASLVSRQRMCASVRVWACPRRGSAKSLRKNRAGCFRIAFGVSSGAFEALAAKPIWRAAHLPCNNEAGVAQHRSSCCGKRTGGGRECREKERCQDEYGSYAVETKVIPFERGSDHSRDRQARN
jgi:hypothetical protein